MEKICSKKGCNKTGEIKGSQGTFYCFQCNRFNKMINQAKQGNKYTPSLKELKTMLPINLICPICSKKMIWCTKLGRLGDVISLQHNHDGSIVLICHSCNSAHGQSHLGDKYFNLKENEKYCPKCKEILSIDKFSNTKCKKDGHNGICKKCDKKKRKIYYHKNKTTGEK